jgi:hypothetical protein
VEHVVVNLVQAIYNKDQDGYMGCLYDTFEFVPDPEDSLVYGDKFVNCNRDKEDQFISDYNDILGESQMWVSIALSGPDETLPNLNDYNVEDSLYRHIYKIEVIPDSAFSSSIPLFIEGYAYLYFKKSDDNYYYIYKWRDQRKDTTDTDTWSKVKGIVYQ